MATCDMKILALPPSKPLEGHDKTRYKHISPLQNLTDNLVNAMQKFIYQVVQANIGEPLTDFDEKLIGGEVKKLLDK